MKRLLPLVLIASAGLVLSTPVVRAQPSDEPEVGAEAPDEPQRPRGKQRRADPLKYVKQLKQAVIMELELDDDQLLALAGLFREHTEWVERHLSERRKAGEENRARARELREKLAEARSAGEDEVVSELAEQLQTLRGGDDVLREATKKFHEAIAEELNEEQNEEFQKILKRLSKDRGRGKGGRGVRDLRRALARVDLTDERKTEVRKLFRDAMRRVGKGRGNPEAMRNVERRLREDILAELDEEQGAAFLAALEEIEKQPDRPVARSRRMRPGRGASRGDRESEGEVDAEPVEEDEPEE